MQETKSPEAAPEALPLRPHHLLCSLGYVGEGYSDAFTANMTKVVTEGLKAAGGDDTLIEITDAADPICAPCPHRRGQGCVKHFQILRLDRAHAARLGVEAGDRLTWGDAKALVRERVKPGDLAGLCTDCRWLELGLCEAALSRLHQTDDTSTP